MEENYFDGSFRPALIPSNWKGRPLKTSNEGWCWFDPENDGNAIFFYKNTETVVVVSDGLCLDQDGRPIHGSSIPND